MAAFGIPHIDIARVVGINRNTLEKHYRYELDTGHVKATAKVAESLYKRATNGNVAAAIFWMKARAGWSEKVEHRVDTLSMMEERERAKSLGERLVQKSIEDKRAFSEATEQTLNIIETHRKMNAKGEEYYAVEDDEDDEAEVEDV